MSQFFISCKESRIENNRSFYGCFQLGPFEPSQSITIANALRRTLLSELYGLSIVSIEIEGATHEYSNLRGVKDSVLDILLNMKEIVLKKTINTIGIKPQIGYLKVRGPGLVRASNLILPPLIQCVDPDQYIATLTNDGFLNMKFVIQYSNKWLSMTNQKSFQQQSTNGINLLKTEKMTNQQSSQPENYNSPEIGTQGSAYPTSLKTINDYNSVFNSHLKKRRLILKKLKQIGLKSSQSNSYINLFSKLIYKQSKKITNQLYPMNSSSLIYKKLDENSTTYFEALKPNDLKHTAYTPWISYVQVPSIKLLKIKKIGKILFEESKSVEIEKKKKLFTIITYLMRKYRKKYPSINLAYKNIARQSKAVKKKLVNNASTLKRTSRTQPIFLNSNPLIIDAIFNPVIKVNYIIEVNDFKMTQNFLESSQETSELFEILNISKTNIKKQNSTINQKTFAEPGKTVEPNFKQEMGLPLSGDIKNPKFLETLLAIKHEMNLLKKETPKHNIILEIWTNGSMHPRDAIYQGFKNLFKTFSKLNKVNTFMINPSIVNSLKNQGHLEADSLTNYKNESQEKIISKDYYFKKLKQKEITSTLTDHLTLSPYSSNLLALNETNFLSTYMSPKLKNFYLNFNNLKSLSNNSGVDTIKFLDGSIASKKFSTNGSPSEIKKSTIVIDSLKNDKITKVSDNLEINSWTQSDSSKRALFGESSNSKTKQSFNEPKKNLESLEINSLNLSLRSYTYLKRLNINTVFDLKLFLNSYSNKIIDNNYLKLNQFALEEIKQSLKRLNL